MRRDGVPEPVVRRLPRYFRILGRLSRQGEMSTSSEALGRELGVSAAQVRRDLSFFGEFGQRGHGYPVEELKKGIAHILGADQHRRLIVVGMDERVRALLRCFDFEKCGFTVDRVFARETAQTEEINGVPVCAMSGLEEAVAARTPKVAVLCVAPEEARELVDRLVPMGVRRFWNFSDCALLSDRADVHIVNNDFADSLLTLGYDEEHHWTDADR